MMIYYSLSRGGWEVEKTGIQKKIEATPLSTTPLSSGSIVYFASQRISLLIFTSVLKKEHHFVITKAFL